MAHMCACVHVLECVFVLLDRAGSMVFASIVLVVVVL